LTGGVRQIGYVVKDLESPMQAWRDRLDVGPFTVVFVDPGDESWFRGRRLEGNEWQLAFAPFGRLELELILPVKGQNVFSEFLHANRRGIHHLALWFDRLNDYDDAVSGLVETGFPSVQHGGKGAARYAYLDTETTFGMYLELVYRDDAPREFHDRILHGLGRPD
jgi:hypothetical protein